MVHMYVSQQGQVVMRIFDCMYPSFSQVRQRDIQLYDVLQ